MAGVPSTKETASPRESLVFGSRAKNPTSPVSKPKPLLILRPLVGFCFWRLYVLVCFSATVGKKKTITKIKLQITNFF